MARTESISIQVHPDDEQNQIQLMQNFHWSLLGSQTIDKTDSALERRGDTIYQVTTSTKYIKLQFSRDLALPNLDKIRRLETEYFALENPSFPSLFPLHWILWAFLAFIYGLGVALWIAYYFLYYKKKKEEADTLLAKVKNRRSSILQELAQFD